MTRMVSVERAAALRNKCLNLTEKLSIGFRFGEGTDVAVATVDVAHWHIASFRSPAEFDRHRGIADSGKPAAQQVYKFTPPYRRPLRPAFGRYFPSRAT